MGANLEFDMELAGASGSKIVIVNSELSVDYGQLRRVVLRLTSSNFTTLAVQFRLAHFPLHFTGITLDQYGRPTTLYDPANAPTERLIHDSGAQAAGAASATTAFYSNYPSNRNLVTGPFVAGITWTSASGSLGSVRAHLELQETKD